MLVNLVHALPEVSSAYGKDLDGFSAAMEVVAAEHDVRWVNVHPANADWREQAKLITDADFVLVRSDWGWYPDAIAAPKLARSGRPCGLVIAGSHPPPSAIEARRYDVLFYETPWYAQFAPPTPPAVEAFGIDTRVMSGTGADRDIDWLMVGRLATFKRPLEMLKKSGNRVAVGDMATADPQIAAALLDDGVQIVDHVSPSELAGLYNRTRGVLVPCELQGGGERAVLEGRACGCEVEVASDNPKLQSLLDSPIHSHVDYAERLLAGIERAARGVRTSRRDKRGGEAVRQAKVIVDKLWRAPSTIKIRTRSALDRLR